MTARSSWARLVPVLVASLGLFGCELVQLPRLPIPEIPSDRLPTGVGQELRLPGVVHRATFANPTRGVALDVPAGTYRRVELEITITNGGWSMRRPRGAHCLFWLVRDRNRDMFGCGFVRHQNRLVLRHGIGQRHGDKAKKAGSFYWAPGASYRLRYVWDSVRRSVRLSVLDGGRTVLAMEDVPNVGAISFRSGQELLVGLGCTGTDNLNEPASIGWVWRDLRMEIR